MYAYMRFVYAFISALLALAVNGADVALAVDTAGLTLEEAGDEPWLASPCMNGGHFYLRPISVRDTGETYPPGLGGVDTSARLSFTRAFLYEDEARGFRAWENHYTLDESGEPVLISSGEDCMNPGVMCRRAAWDIMSAALLQNGENRVALTFAGGRFDTRFCMNLTRDENKLCSALWAAPATASGDIETALIKAHEYIGRRNADEKRSRPAVIIIVTADKEGARTALAQYKERAQPDAAVLIIDAKLWGDGVLTPP